jgi:hypothetical protein
MEISQKEKEFIQKLRSNDPAVGYNRWPKLKSQKSFLKAKEGRMAVLD